MTAQKKSWIDFWHQSGNSEINRTQNLPICLLVAELDFVTQTDSARKAGFVCKECALPSYGIKLLLYKLFDIKLSLN